MNSDPGTLLNLAATWKDLGKGDDFKEAYYAGAFATLLILCNIEDLHGDNPAAKQILIDALDKEIRDFLFAEATEA